MKIVSISDTHSKHDQVIIPPCDILIHAGDFTYFSRGGFQEIINFFNWFYQQPAKHKIFIAGNHEKLFESQEKKILELLPPGVTYLNDSIAEVEGIKIWGSPITPWFEGWAYNRYRGQDIKKHWDLIPKDIDILVTHGPAMGITDQVGNTQVGCKDLLDAIKRVKPKIHCFGHMHRHEHLVREIEGNKIGFYNSALVDNKYNIKHQPFVFEAF